MSKKMKLIIIIIEIIVLLGLSGYRVYEYINKDSNINENVKKYKVTFDYRDNAVRSIEVEENKKIEFPDKPIKEGYIFDGWLLNNVIIDENYKVNEDITLKANWINENINSEIKILVYEINIRQEADVNSTDLGDVYFDQVYDVLDIVETDTYTWYKIKKDNIVGYVANQKGEEWIEIIQHDDVSDKVLYFYDQDGILYVDKLDNNRNYIGSYDCKSDDCFAYSVTSYGNMYDLNKKTIAISDNLNYFIYNYDKQKIVSNKYSCFSVFQNVIVATKNNKKVIMDLSGKELSKHYDNLFDWGLTPHSLSPAQDYSLVKNIVVYENNGKEGLLSLSDYSEITEAKYENISIDKDNIVVRIDGLEYVMDEKGKIISKGYNEILYSNDKIIIIEENGMLDIIDYNGNSKINEKIYTNGYKYNRTNFYEIVGPQKMIFIKNDGNKISISVPSQGFDSTYGYDVYTYDANNNLLNVLRDSERRLAVSSAYSVLDAVEYHYTMSLLSSEPLTLPLTVDFSNSGNINEIQGKEINMYGTRPSSGKVTLKPTGEYDVENLVINGYYCVYNDEIFTCEK